MLSALIYNVRKQLNTTKTVLILQVFVHTSSACYMKCLVIKMLPIHLEGQ